MRTLILTMGMLGAAVLPVQSMQDVPPRPPVLAHSAAQLEHAMRALELSMPTLHARMAAFEQHRPALEHGIAVLEASMPHLERSMVELAQRLPSFEYDMAALTHAVPALARLGYIVGTDAALVLPPESWDQEDPADSLWRAAREQLNGGDNRAAAATYRRIRTNAAYARSTYRDDAYYYEAFVLQRLGGRDNLRAARTLLADLRRTYPRFEGMSNVTDLENRITADLAELGDPVAAQTVATTVTSVTSAQCPELETQKAALAALYSMPAATAAPILRRLMARRDACSETLREQAIHLISRDKSTETADVLLESAKSDPSPKVRQQAVFWLANVDSERAVDAIQEIMRSNTADRQTLEMAVYALSRHKSARASQLLRDIATRPDTPPQVRAAAIHWLSQRNDLESSAFLRNLYSSLTDQGSKELVLYALSRQKTQENADFLLNIALNERESQSVRQTALHWAGQSGQLPIAKLAELYDKAGTRAMKEQLLHTLSQRKEPEALDKLMSIAKNDADANLRKAAIFWIGRSTDPRALKFLADLIGG